MYKSLLSLALLIALVALAACSAPDTTPTAPVQQSSPFVVNGAGESLAEQAHEHLLEEGEKVYLILLSPDSPDVQGLIYYDLQKRDILATTGPDEGFDTHNLFCYPRCVFVRKEDASISTVESWTALLRHEYRHIAQAENNPEMAHDFRNPDGRFTTYAAFMEACADYGLNIKVSYHAQERIDSLKQGLSTDFIGVLDRACKGDEWAYQAVRDQYNKRIGFSRAFDDLFPSYE